MDRRALDECSGAVIAAALKVHSHLGPGLLEGAYEACLSHELRNRGWRVETQVPMPLDYDGVRIELGYRLDLLVESALVVELKAVRRLMPIHQAQLLSYLRLGRFRVGLLINFAEEHLKHGLKRIVHAF